MFHFWNKSKLFSGINHNFSCLEFMKKVFISFFLFSNEIWTFTLLPSLLFRGIHFKRKKKWKKYFVVFLTLSMTITMKSIEKKRLAHDGCNDSTFSVYRLKWSKKKTENRIRLWLCHLKFFKVLENYDNFSITKIMQKYSINTFIESIHILYLS